MQWSSAIKIWNNIFNMYKRRPAQEVKNLPCKYVAKICNKDMQSPILRRWNYVLKICSSVPGLHDSGHQSLNGIGGRRHEGAARKDNIGTLCFGHNAAPWNHIGNRTGQNESFRLRGPCLAKICEIKAKEDQNWHTKILWKSLRLLACHRKHHSSD